jgi:hypothetical protein
MIKLGEEMKFENVDELIEDILHVPTNALEIAEQWLSITKLLAEMISNADDLLIIQTYSQRYTDCDPYLQICFEDDRAMTIEAVSNKFLTPPLSVDAQNTILHRENAEPYQVAQLFTATLRNVYGITPDDELEITTGRGVWSNEQTEFPI